MEYFGVVNWDKYQHYKDDRPVHWVKLHLSMLNDYDFGTLTDTQKGQLIRMSQKRNPKVFEQVTMSAAEVQAKMKGSACAWDGCKETYEGSIPKDWRFLLVYWGERPDPNATLGDICCGKHSDRDGVLCPTHTRRLDALLKNLGRWAGRPMGGTA